MRLLLALVASIASPLSAQAVGDLVVMQSSNSAGVPVHAAAGDASFVRWANGTRGKVTAIDAPSGWRKVEAAGTSGWIVPRYLVVITEDVEEPEPPTDEMLTYVIGTWNLEHFRDGATRGFPENGFGGPSYPPRTDADYAAVAGLIANDLTASILILNEINGAPGPRSLELDRLIQHLGGDWAYSIAASGGTQRVAILFDSSHARRASCVELDVPARTVQGKDILARDPLACRFVLRARDGSARNDLLVVGVHLAAGQDLAQNHNDAMIAIRDRLRQAVQGGAFATGERDILIGGDLNASRYDDRIENFWENFDAGAGGYRFRTLAPTNEAEYAGTRLAGVPLFPRSRIDYLLSSDGLIGELALPLATVHVNLLPADFNAFRARFSDHLPVTVRVRVIADDDP